MKEVVIGKQPRGANNSKSHVVGVIRGKHAHGKSGDYGCSPSSPPAKSYVANQSETECLFGRTMQLVEATSQQFGADDVQPPAADQLLLVLNAGLDVTGVLLGALASGVAECDVSVVVFVDFCSF